MTDKHHQHLTDMIAETKAEIEKIIEQRGGCIELRQNCVRFLQSTQNVQMKVTVKLVNYSRGPVRWALY